MIHKTTIIVNGIISALLLLCLIDADYGYYQAMRTLISFGFAFLTYRHYQAGDKAHALVYLCLLVVFQPLMKIAFGREIWIVINILAAGYLMYNMWKSCKTKNHSQ